MRLLIIRHGDPDYEHDTLTPQGEREAELLGQELSHTPIDAAYVSPLGRAKRTAQLALAGRDIPCTECAWLREFDPRIPRPDREGLSITWDWLPEHWTAEPDFLSEDTWLRPEPMDAGHVAEACQEVCTGLDVLLDRHGYHREGQIYRAQRPSHDTIALFCHFGVESVVLGHLLHISPMLLWHGFCALPTSVTTVYTEERRQGTASFRVSEYGALPHLRRAGVEPSFSARFCECFHDDTRHD